MRLDDLLAQASEGIREIATGTGASNVGGRFARWH